MEPFDYYKEFLGIDIAKAEQVSALVGRIIGSFREGIKQTGIEDIDANILIADLIGTIMHEILRFMNEQRMINDINKNDDKG